MTIKLISAQETDVNRFVLLESASDAHQYIVPYSADRHAIEMGRENTHYLSIYDSDEMIGFMILAVEEGESVEFRRIVIDKKDSGVGQKAIIAMEQYCREKLNKYRIWLDVFESNQRAMHIYKKCGFKTFSSGMYHQQRIWLMEKYLA